MRTAASLERFRVYALPLSTWLLQVKYPDGRGGTTTELIFVDSLGLASMAVLVLGSGWRLFYIQTCMHP